MTYFQRQIVELVQSRRVDGEAISRILGVDRERVYEALVNLEAIGALRVEPYHTKQGLHCRWLADA